MTDVDTLMQEARCFTCLGISMAEALQLALLAQIVAGGGSGGQSCLLCGIVDPTAPPACECAIYINKAPVTSVFWYWDSGAAQWQPFG